MVLFIAILVSSVVSFAAGIILKSKLVAAEQQAAAALKSTAQKAINKL